MKKKKASSTLYFIFFFIIFLAFCAFAVDGTIVFTNRTKLQTITETAALAGAEMFNSDDDPSAISGTERSDVDAVARSTFALLKASDLKTAKVDNVEFDPPTGRRVVLTTSMVSQPFFLSFLGVSGITLSAQAKAMSEPKHVFGTLDESGIHWLTKRAPYKRDVIIDDSVILKPLGEFPDASFQSANVKYDLISSDDSEPLSLGAGGFVTIKLPVPIINKKGPDLQIIESGAQEGYMVFAGLDKLPDNPYINSTDVGGGLSWVNISCTGGATMHPDSAATRLAGAAQVKVYGSGNFDLDNHCAGGISMIKYIRIVDDNEESGYVGGTKVMLYGEASSPTPGADIDTVKVLNYVHLTQ